MFDFETSPYVANHCFSFVDSAVLDVQNQRYWRGDWNNDDWVNDMVGVADGVVSIFSPRAAGKVPVVVQMFDEAPAVDLDPWDHAIEASLEIHSGNGMVIGENNDESEPPLELDMPAGTWRVLALYGNLASCEYDGDNGDDHYLILVWPAAATAVQVLKRFEIPEDW